VPCVDIGDPATAWEIRRWRTIFQLPIEHRIWTPWHGQSVSEGHHRSSGSIHVNCADLGTADPDRLAISVAIDTSERTDSNTDSGAGAATFPGNTGRIACCESVVVFLKSIPAIMAAARKDSLHAEVAELADAHV
jgi:hypothetical protein